MVENLVIVESPAKAKTIEKFLGKSFTVMSSFGHIRDLAKKNLGIDIKNNFNPDYVVSDDKKKIVAELKKNVKEAKMVWLASDEDREGEAIAWHLAEVLQLDEKKTKRIVFNEITKEAIQNAIKNPRNIDKNLVDAQQARRILDRLVGFELSPVLWKKVKPSLSAGRVQSVAVRLLVDREREIIAFKPSSSYKTVAVFEVVDNKGKKVLLEAELDEKFNTKAKALEFLKACSKAQFSIEDVVTKPSKRSPSAPFTTSTLQQEASRKLGFSVSQTMTIAQKLYEAGKITYMRTDSVNLSETALKACKEVINKEFGNEYHNLRQYKTKSKGAQEAHEAIRPAYFDQETVQGSAAEKKLYSLIYKRTLASQMSDALFERTTVSIKVEGLPYHFVATGEVLKFDGFLKMYIESNDEESESDNLKILPPLTKNQPLNVKNITSTERFTHHPPRYTEASLVRKLEELGIGRPSTYAPIISTIQQREYVVKTDRDGSERNFDVLKLENKNVTELTEKETFNAEKAKLFPTDIGILVTDYLVDHFKDIMDYNFTANVEKDFDEIAEGKMLWTKMLDAFYAPFHKKVEMAIATRENTKGDRLIGNDLVSGKPIIARIGRFGPMVQIGQSDDEEKPRYAKLQPGQYIETITLEQALNLFQLPKKLGSYENYEVSVGIGRFGPYILHHAKYYSLVKGVDDPYNITLQRAIELINDKREKDKNKVINSFEYQKSEIQVLNGRFGPYICYNKENYKIPKNTDATKLTAEQCIDIIQKGASTTKTKKKRK
ncbi:MAG TPA: type I DNA topoisomerase [Bacteroidales bacterium]|nr:type I DNA topoisomerase [Bacteroidales bacterium]